jgi:hypothetical protein
MPMSLSSAAVAAALLSLSSLLPGPAAAGRDLDAAVARLEAWLDANSPYRARDVAPAIEIVAPEVAASRIGQRHGSGGILRGLYDPDTRIISLVAPWSADSDADLSVLLHELAHHRQQTARHWYCAGAQELPAYRLQAAWLRDHGAEIEINWMAAVLQSGCGRRDHHPD